MLTNYCINLFAPLHAFIEVFRSCFSSRTAGTIGALKWGVFLAGILLVGQFSFWGNYIPRVFPVHLRGTGESFAANIGGRVLGTSMAWHFFTFSAATPPNPSKMAYTAATIAAVMALLTLVIIPFMTEPKAEDAE